MAWTLSLLERRARELTCAAALYFATPAYAESARAPDVREEVCLELERALWRPGPANASDLVLWLLREDGRWVPVVWGRSYRYNHGDHLGCVTRVAEEGDGAALSIHLLVREDKWTGGGQAAYDLRIRRTGDAFEGRWKGRWLGEEREGKVSGSARVVRPCRAGFAAPAPGEHPRLLVRRGDLPALRAKAATDWGRAAAARLEGTVGTALRYALSGDPALVDAARQRIEADYARRVANWRLPHDLPDALVDLAIAYDLIHDACAPDYRARMRARFEDMLPYVHTGANYVYGLFNPADVSNWGARFRAGAAFCAFSLLDEGDVPEPPAPRILRLAPPEAPAPGAAGPAVRLAPGATLRGWLAAGPFPIAPEADGLAALGGEARAAPRSGTKVSVDAPEKTVRTFAPVDPTFILTPEWAKKTHNEWMEGGVDLTALAGRAYEQTVYLYAVVENEAAGHFRVDYSTWGLLKPRLVLAGRTLSSGDVVFLDRGRFPALFAAPLKRIKDSQQTPFALRFHAATETEAQDWLRTASFAHGVEDAARRHARERRAQGVAAGFESVCRLLPYRVRMENYARFALGENGWNSEGECYAQPTVRLIFPFAQAYRNVTGFEFSTAPNLAGVLPLGAARTIFGESGARMEGYGAGGGPLGVDLWPRGFGCVPAPLRPATLWAWNRTQALADAGRLTDPHQPVNQMDDLSVAFWFVHYPLDLQEENPSKHLRSVTVDRQRGGYVFRNRWRDADDCVVSLLANAGLNDDGRWLQAGGYDLGIRGLRSIGVDYSGASGAPCLVAVADTIAGSAGRNRWEFCTPGEHAVTVEGGGFLVKAAGGATLKASVVAPAGAKIATTAMVLNHEIQCVPGRHANADFKRTIVTVPGGDFFFIVMTVQRGPAPDARVEGAGLLAQAVVGGQAVSFDGRKIVFGRAAAR